MVIVLKDKGSVYVAVGTNRVNSPMHTEDKINEENVSVWRVPNSEDAIMASTIAYGLDVDILRYKDFKLSGAMTQNGLWRKVIPEIKSVLASCDMMDGDEAWEPFVIAKGNRAFYINCAFMCREITDFMTLGNLEEVTHGAMLKHRDKPPVERIAESVRFAERVGKDRIFPIVIMNTQTRERTVLYE